ncbi:MAG: GrpB family protein [Arenimonas sp.]|nr:GrpB family protein [Arenimonas sp.]
MNPGELRLAAVGIDSFEIGCPLVPLLEYSGYQYRGEYGIPRRHYLVRGTQRRTHHLNMLEQETGDGARHIRFCDRLPGTVVMAVSRRCGNRFLPGLPSKTPGCRIMVRSCRDCFAGWVQSGVRLQFPKWT